jgi:Tol biopolymer transport system component
MAQGAGRRVARLVTSARLALGLALLVALFTCAASGQSRATVKPRLLFTSDRTGVVQIYSYGPGSGGLAQLTFGRTPSSTPVPSPDGRLIVFSRSGWLLTMRADGRGQRRLVRGAQPAWAPDSNRIVYAARDGLRSVKVDGGGARRVTRNPRDVAPALSPDGRSLLLVRANSPSTGILVVIRAGREHILRRVADFGDSPGDGPVWSPDGRSIAFIGDSDDIEIVRSSGGRPRFVGSGDRFSWSPDGRRIARMTTLPGSDGQTPIIVVDLRTDAETYLNDADGRVRPAWSADGRSLAFVPAQGFGAMVEVAVLGGATRAAVPAVPFIGNPRDLAWMTPRAGLRFRPPERWPTQLVGSSDEDLSFVRMQSTAGSLILGDPNTGDHLTISPNATHPAWSPDGRRVSFAQQRDIGPGGELSAATLFVADRNGCGAVQIGANAAPSTAWSPDGTSVAFTAQGRIVVASADGKTSAILTDGSSADGAPSWSPDGARIAFLRSNRTSTAIASKVWVMNKDGSDQQRLTGALGTWAEQSPSWSPDGRTIAFAVNSGKWRIWLVAADGSTARQLSAREVFLSWYPDGTTVAAASWSPDGTAVAFRAEPTAVGGIGVIARIDGSGERLLASGGLPVWSPDGRLLALGGRVIRTEGNQTPILVSAGVSQAWVPAVNGPISATCGRAIGTPGPDLITGSPTRDQLTGRAGADRISARDGQSDTIDCGKGTDIVDADPQDIVARNCERVRR